MVKLAGLCIAYICLKDVLDLHIEKSFMRMKMKLESICSNYYRFIYLQPSTRPAVLFVENSLIFMNLVVQTRCVVYLFESI